VFHFLVQASVELRRPIQRSIEKGLDLRGWVGASIEAYAAGCRIDPLVARGYFSDYVDRSLLALELSAPRRHVRIRRKLVNGLERRAELGRLPGRETSPRHD
jgi:hypothetical protein